MVESLGLCRVIIISVGSGELTPLMFHMPLDWKQPHELKIVLLASCKVIYDSFGLCQNANMCQLAMIL